MHKSEKIRIWKVMGSALIGAVAMAAVAMIYIFAHSIPGLSLIFFLAVIALWGIHCVNEENGKSPKL